MKFKQTLFLSILFSLSIFVGVLHQLEHTHSESENCMVCHIQNHSDSGDISPKLVQEIEFFHFEAPQNRPTVFTQTTFQTTLYGRAPPIFS